jgi:hypothetical protein
MAAIMSALVREQFDWGLVIRNLFEDHEEPVRARFPS